MKLTSRQRWLVTGVAGFIGSHLLEELLRQDQGVVGLDNFSTGHRANLDAVRRSVGEERWRGFEFREGDITHPDDVVAAMRGCDWVLHQAALGSVPLSMEWPVATHAANVTGFVNVLEAARVCGVRRVVYASSSAVYGDAEEVPAREERLGRPLSPYALSKHLNEQYADVFSRCYGLSVVGLRYFNVCGTRQDPAGAYAAVIPRWVDALWSDREAEVFGDGETTRDFCPVAVVVDANLRAAVVELPADAPRVFNVGLGRETTLNALFQTLARQVAEATGRPACGGPVHRKPRAGDVRRSCADLTRARRWYGLSADASLEACLGDIVRGRLTG